MVKQSYNSGFTLVEVAIILVICSLFTIMTLPKFKMIDLSHYLFANEYLMFQSSCIKEQKTEEFIVDENVILRFPLVFNEKGNVQLAQTIRFTTKSQVELVSQLGGGRLEFK